MKKPVYINAEIVDNNKNVNIVAGVIDLHYTEIKRMFNTEDGYTAILTNDNMVIKVLVPFTVMYSIYNEQQQIDETFKEEVDEYLKDNYKALKKNNGKAD